MRRTPLFPRLEGPMCARARPTMAWTRGLNNLAVRRLVKAGHVQQKIEAALKRSAGIDAPQASRRVDDHITVAY